MVTLTQVGTNVYLGQTYLGSPFQVPAWVRKFSLGSTGYEISSLIIIQSLFVLSSPLLVSAEMIEWLQVCSDPSFESNPSNEYSLLRLTHVLNSIFLDPSSEYWNPQTNSWLLLSSFKTRLQNRL